MRCAWASTFPQWAQARRNPATAMPPLLASPARHPASHVMLNVRVTGHSSGSNQQLSLSSRRRQRCEGGLGIPRPVDVSRRPL